MGLKNLTLKILLSFRKNVFLYITCNTLDVLLNNIAITTPSCRRRRAPARGVPDQRGALAPRCCDRPADQWGGF